MREGQHCSSNAPLSFHFPFFLGMDGLFQYHSNRERYVKGQIAPSTGLRDLGLTGELFLRIL
jgi:hypothetical protein